MKKLSTTELKEKKRLHEEFRRGEDPCNFWFFLDKVQGLLGNNDIR